MTFNDKELVRIVSTQFVPVAAEQHTHGNRQDAEGEFYGKIVAQRGRDPKEDPHQGFYLFSPAGKLLVFWHGHGAEGLKKQL